MPKCLGCQANNDAVTPMGDNPDLQPSDGDATVCLYCGELMMFDQHGTAFRHPTDLEKVSLLADPDTVRALLAVRTFIDNKKRPKKAGRTWKAK